MISGLSLAILYSLAMAPLFFIRTETFGAALQQYSPAERWSAIGSAVIVSTHMTLASAMVGFTPTVPLGFALLSVVVFVCGIGFWVWARMQISPLNTRPLPDQPPVRLRRDGAFGIVRNPLYLGMLVAVAAPLIIVPRLLLAVTYVLAAGALVIRALLDERRLHAQLGPEYDSYCREVKRLVPFVW